MNIKRAKEIIAILAEGVDPTTGEVLPADHVCNKAEVVRAFYAILNESKKNLPKNAGKLWTDEDDKLLLELYQSGLSISKLKDHFKRTKGSIESRLEKLGVDLTTQDSPSISKTKNFT